MKTTLPLLAPLAAMLLAASPLAIAPVLAQDARDDGESLAQSAVPAGKYSILVTYGDEPCPEAQGDEIVVCAQKPESERYRVPKELRHEDDEAVSGGGSWASAVEGYNDGIARLGRPNSCSAVGSNGFTGCTALMLRQWFEERRAGTP